MPALIPLSVMLEQRHPSLVPISVMAEQRRSLIPISAMLERRRSRNDIRSDEALAPASAAFRAAPTTESLTRASAYAAGRRGEVAFAVIGGDGALSGRDLDRPFRSASVVKAMLLVAYLDASERRSRRLVTTEEGLLGAMVRESDNAAADSIYAAVGSEGLERLAERAGMRSFEARPAWGNSTITAADQARYFHRLPAVIPPAHRGFASRQLGGVVESQRWGIPRATPGGWKVLFKGGWRPTPSGALVHQVARLEAPHGPHLALAILTEGNPSHHYGTDSVEGIAARVVGRG